MSEKPMFEQSMDRLDQIVSLLERNEIALEQAIGLFEEGLNLVQDLDTQLQGYENKVQELMLRHQPKESQDENL
ncbi:exodeoxyribonuclease VII small subunit [Holdemania filiformis]|uniref:exodeoxyribonuclease VII small subunit n=1 Tax=Holdemania filiformis TaxID=61171 RepID=UPI00266F52CD|nr:exodeoxyribonuclease VII small subunit [Holdemania filiformis]